MIHICAPRAPIRCHALTTLRASRRRMAQHDKYYLGYYTRLVTRADPNCKNLNKRATNERVWHRRLESTTSVIREMKHQTRVIPQIIYITRRDTPHRTIYLAWLIRLNLKVSVIREMSLRESTYRRDEFTRKYTSFWLSHPKRDSGDYSRVVRYVATDNLYACLLP